MVLAFPMFRKTGLTVRCGLFLLLKFINFPGTASGLVKLGLFGKARLFWESKKCMAYCTVKPSFVKFLSYLSFKLGDLAKHSGDCFVVGSAHSYLAMGYLVGRLHLIVVSCGRLRGKEECEHIHTVLILYNLLKESRPEKQVRKLWFM